MVHSATSAESSSSAVVNAVSMNAHLAAMLQSKDAQIASLSEQNSALQRQLEWFRRQLFGQKSERFIAAEPNPAQLPLADVLTAPAATPAPMRPIAAHTRRVNTKRTEEAESAEALPFFDESRVPVQTIVLMPETVQGLTPDQYEIISEKVTYRLAQRPGAFQVIAYRRPVVKLKDRQGAQTIHTVPAPPAVFEGSRADVSFIVGLILDKFAWHLPLYRQHQRLTAAGITVSRGWLTQLVQAAARLLEPIYAAQFASIRASRVIAMDETPIKAGRSGHGNKMKSGYFWPLYGERDEVCFPFHPSRSGAFVGQALGLGAADAATRVLLTDGYAAYARYAEKVGVTHALCWAHARRAVFEAKEAEPGAVAEVLEVIQDLYAVEARIRELKLQGEAKHLHRLTHSKPIVEFFFDAIERQLAQHGLAPANPFIRALNYVRERKAGLQAFLADPDVPIDTNHLERALRPIPLGKKNWLFCWTEVGAQHVGILQSLIVTCRLHGIDPYTYFVDVLQRIGEHPNSRVAELTPRRWKTGFADHPLRSDIAQFPNA